MIKNSKHQERGTLQSYVVGYILSLVFTAIPFYFIINQTITGNMLLATILGFAFLQMAVQMIFFLHLGRGPQPLYNVGFFAGTFGAIMVVVGGSVYIMSQLHGNVVPIAPAEKSLKLAEDEGIYQIRGEKTGACQGLRTNYKVTIKDGVVSPGYVEARYCDTITFVKEDDVDRMLTFGMHPQQGSYAGEAEVPLRKGRGNTITLGQTGTYQYHDHLNPATAGYFTVLPE